MTHPAIELAQCADWFRTESTLAYLRGADNEAVILAARSELARAYNRRAWNRAWTRP